MRQFLFTPVTLLMSLTSFSQETATVRDIIHWRDFGEAGAEEFRRGDALYNLTYKRKVLSDNGKRDTSFMFSNKTDVGGLLISVDRSRVKEVNVHWNWLDGYYRKDMFMYLNGSNAPFAGVKEVLDSKPKGYSKFEYRAAQTIEGYTIPGEPEWSRVSLESSFKHFALTPSYYVNREYLNYITEIEIIREIDINEHRHAILKDVSAADYDGHHFCLVSEAGRLITIAEESDDFGNTDIDITTDGEIFPDAETLAQAAKFTMNIGVDGGFTLSLSGSGKLLGVTSTGALSLQESPCEFTLGEDGEILTGSDTPLEFSKQMKTARNIAKRNNLYLFRSDEVSVPTAVESIPDNTAAPVTYFDLNGQRLPAAPAAPGLYIRRTGSKVEKEVVR